MEDECIMLEKRRWANTNSKSKKKFNRKKRKEKKINEKQE